MKTLIIKAHPSSKGFTHKIAEIYQKTAQAKDKTWKFETIDLYKCPQEYFNYEKLEDLKKLDKEQKKYQKMIKDADELLLIFPIWWGDAPAILKNWWDSNMTSGFAFEYKNKRPVGLLSDKTAKIITTSGAPKFFYILNGIYGAVKTIWKKSRLKFCGIKLKSFTLLGSFSIYERNEKAAIEKIKKLI